jgi:hypothetical protein
MEEYVTRLEYDEHNRRTDDEHRRTNKRLELLEENVQQLADLTASVRELTVSVGNLAAKQEDMVTRVDAIEKEPAKNWSTLKTGILSAIAAAIGSGLVAAVVSFIR